MNSFKIVNSIIAFCIVTFFSTLSYGQDDNLLASNIPAKKGAFNESIEVSEDDVAKKIPDFYRKHKKMPAYFSGYAIELTTSDFPLRRDYDLFEKFGNVHIHQLKEGGYSYLIKGFRNKKACSTFFKMVVSHKAPEARIIKYKKGEREAFL